MMKTRNFVKLDFSVVKPYYKSMILLPVIAVFIGFAMKNIYFTIILLTGYSWMVSIYPFSIGEKFNLDVMYLALPGSRRQVVRGRFLYFIVLYWITALVGVSLGYIMHVVSGFEFNVTQGFLLVIGIFPFVSLIVGIFYCILFRFGYLKAKLINLIPIILIYAIGELINTFVKNRLIEVPDISPLSLCVFCLLGGAVILYIFSNISQKIYKAKDF